MTEEVNEEETKNETGLTDSVVEALTHLHESGLRFLTIIVQPSGELTMHTASGSNRIEITGLLEVARDAIKS
tara:strand:+ start:132 stop:347 length:216 start_codon:yes stop_codon:yes gene_type:complete